LTLGSVLNTDQDTSWSATLIAGDLNRYSRSTSTTASNKTHYREAELTHSRAAFGGALKLGLGYEYRKDTVLDDTDHDLRVFAGWAFEY